MPRKQEEMKIGDKVINDLTGEECIILDIQDRNAISCLRNIKLIGNVVLLENSAGVKEMVFEWEVSEINET